MEERLEDCNSFAPIATLVEGICFPYIISPLKDLQHCKGPVELRATDPGAINRIRYRTVQVTIRVTAIRSGGKKHNVVEPGHGAFNVRSEPKQHRGPVARRIIDPTAFMAGESHLDYYYKGQEEPLLSGELGPCL